MNLRMTYFIFAILISLPLAIAQARQDRIDIKENGLLGNGGIGVFHQGRLILKDLYDDKNLSPYFGESIDPEILTSVQSSSNVKRLGLDVQLFARKLTDLNKVRPRLGFHVLTILNAHLLTFTTTSEAPLFEKQSVLMALRTSNSIRIIAVWFKILSPEQKVALAIHEGLFSFVRLKCIDSTFCTQDPSYVQRIVADLFRPDFENDRTLVQLIDTYLALPAHSAKDYPELEVIISNFEGKESQRVFLDPDDVQIRSIVISHLCSTISLDPSRQDQVSLRFHIFQEQPSVVMYQKRIPGSTAIVYLTANSMSWQKTLTTSEKESLPWKTCIQKIQDEADMLIKNSYKGPSCTKTPKFLKGTAEYFQEQSSPLPLEMLR